MEAYCAAAAPVPTGCLLLLGCSGGCASQSLLLVHRQVIKNLVKPGDELHLLHVSIPLLTVQLAARALIRLPCCNLLLLLEVRRRVCDSRLLSMQPVLPLPLLRPAASLTDPVELQVVPGTVASLSRLSPNQLGAHSCPTHMVTAGGAGCVHLPR